MKRKLLSLLLVLAMVFTLFPVAAFAEGSAAKSTSVTKGDLKFEIYQGETADESYAVVVGVSGSGITEVTIPEAVNDVPVTAIEANAFEGTGIQTITIPETVTEIGQEAFMDCTDLAAVNFEGSDAYLGERAFKNCTSLVDMYVPASGILYDGTFAGCTSLAEVTFEYGNMYIEEGAFSGCTNLEYIYLPASIEQIYTKDFEGMKDVTVGGLKGSVAERFATKLGFQFEAEDYPDGLFTDVSAGRHYSVPVLWAASTGVTQGYEDGSFRPDAVCKRWQMVMFIWRFFGEPEATTTTDFKDVPKTAIYYDAVQWAAEYGITNGTGNGNFSPDREVSRGMVVTMLNRLDGEPKASSNTNNFKDVTKNSYYDAILWAQEVGVTKGYTDGTFKPNKTCSRGEIVTFMYRNLYSFYSAVYPDAEFVS